ncbi:M13 family metallopeptidase [Sphingomonas sp. BIUV-7]|uniref:M13 family metallopeptidase n=1 Tax=Sphingomonas natans TaxID=3063330 RepID=A0ABT8Y4F0_9SPHN|nr:M13 family metallopeptidase [Sphingomonas sp. BIUV-7]MDO6413198.1 M13 family metallopeptidase [Sphingomonas sp. BIUV-7]
MRKGLKIAMLAGSAFASVAAAPVAKPELGTWGVDLTARDTNVKPGDDFARFANGAWLARTEIAPDRTRAGAFITLQDRSEADVRGLVEAIPTNPAATPAERKIADLYASWMDEGAIDAAGAKPLAPYLAEIDAVKDRAGLIRLFASPDYAAPGAAVGIRPDVDDPTHYAVSVRQGSLGLPGRDYYLEKGAKYETIRAAYRTYLTQIATLAGLPDPAGRANRMIALETRIAADQWAPAQRRDVTKTTNRMTVAELTALAPQFDWPVWLRAQGLGSPKRLIVGEKSAIAAAGQRLDDVPLAQWKDYLALRFVSDHAQYLAKPFDEAKFAFFGKALADQPRQRDRWKRGVALVNAALGEEVGRLYVARTFPPESERQMGELIGDLRAAYGELIANASWMDAPTRKEALTKLASFDPRIGHPATYIDYSALRIERGDLLGNAVRSDRFDWALQLARFPKPVDRALWNMTPQTVNAYYSPPMNQITFPAAILRPPFFDPAADPAVNYGAIAAVIGHEMGHGFDDQGRQYDATGKLRDWWTKESAASYTGRADRLAAQYDGYEPLPGLHVNGRLTLGENLGDLGGIQAGYTAYQRYLARHGRAATVDGLTGDQRFFLSYAQIWRAKSRDGFLRQQILTDPHSPESIRINGIVRNFDPWYRAFDVKPGDRLYLPTAERVRVW